MQLHSFPERLKNARNAPFYQCPQCRTVWLVMGAQAPHPYTCKQCGHVFDLAQARYAHARRDKDETELLKAA
jgi:Zn-finger nucleic acid-binding protein